MSQDGFALDSIKRLANLGRRVFMVIEEADECSNGALEVDVVFPERIVCIDEQILACGKLRHVSMVKPLDKLRLAAKDNLAGAV